MIEVMGSSKPSQPWVNQWYFQLIGFQAWPHGGGETSRPSLSLSKENNVEWFSVYCTHG